jgi:putative hydrolase of HD superfamily
MQELVLRLTLVERRIHLHKGDADRYENDAEHTYSLTMLVWFLSQYYPDLNLDLMIKYSLVHDMVEVYAGDSQAINRSEDEEKKKDQQEEAALERLKSEWTDFQQMSEYMGNYESQNDPESRFVKALDKIQTIVLNIVSGGHSWKIQDLTMASIVENKDRTTAMSPEIHELWKELRSYMLANEKELFGTS